MDDDTFQFIVSKVSSVIAKQSIHLRNPRSMEDCLMVTLQFLLTGESFKAVPVQYLDTAEHYFKYYS
jgi:hypothetical protein